MPQTQNGEEYHGCPFSIGTESKEKLASTQETTAVKGVDVSGRSSRERVEEGSSQCSAAANDHQL